MFGRPIATAMVTASVGTTINSTSQCRRRNIASATSMLEACTVLCMREDSSGECGGTIARGCGHTAATLRRNRPCTVHLDRDAAPEQINGEDEEPFVGLLPHQDALYVGERPASDADTLAFAQVRVRKHGEASLQRRLNRLDLIVRNLGQAVPSLSQDAHEPPHLAYLDVTRLVQRVAEEEVAGKHGDLDTMADAGTPRPYIDGRQECVKPRRGELIPNQPLTVTPRPEGVPSRDHRPRVFRAIMLAHPWLRD